MFQSSRARLHSRTITKDIQDNLTPEEALSLLEQGNRRFAAGEMLERNLISQVEQTAQGQHPFAAILGCIDSRVSPEIVFDQGIGDLFVSRVAGNIVTNDILGSLEFAVKVAGAKLIVVLGHTSCGAVTGACSRVELGHLTNVVEQILPAIEVVEAAAKRRISMDDTDLIDEAARINVTMAVEDILTRSQVIAELVDQGAVRVLGAMYDVETGQVALMG